MYLPLLRRLWTWLVAVAVAAAGAGFLVARSGPQLPAGVRVIDVLSTSEFRQQPVTAVVTNRATVRKIEGWISDMNAPSSGGSYSCPYFGPGWPTVTLRFLSGSNGRVLATATQRNAVGSGPCNPLNLRVPGHSVSRLLGGTFLERVQHLLGVPLGLGSGTITGVIQQTAGTLGRRPATSSAGTVTAYGIVGSTGRRVAANGVMLPRPGDFKLSLPPGTYELQAHLPKHPPDCKPTTITVHAGQHAQLTLPVGCST